MNAYNVLFTKQAEKNLARLASYDTKNILRRLQQLTVPFSKNLDIKKIVGTPGFYRLRSGSVRALFEVLEKQKEIWVRKIDYRGNIY
ncbi:MAG: type II toxin-antitoxin system RelE/ParE family toxin [Candidatus Gottesmanbacteria bacterium]|nr:type II toxin-antitoxin system RelE/ParE family toxin [Candidatus Gottesmanbacteria bacterium]